MVTSFRFVPGCHEDSYRQGVRGGVERVGKDHHRDPVVPVEDKRSPGLRTSPTDCLSVCREHSRIA